MRGTGIILIASNYTKILILCQHTVNTFKQNVAHKKNRGWSTKGAKWWDSPSWRRLYADFLRIVIDLLATNGIEWYPIYFMFPSLSTKILHVISLNYEVSWVMWTQLITKTSSTHFKCCVEFFFNFKSNKSNQTHTNWIAVCSHSTVISSCLF